MWVFERPDLNPKEFLDFSKTVSLWVGHNIIGFDLPNLAAFGLHQFIDSASVVDTLVVSRLVNYKFPGGHSLEVWGTRLALPVSKVQITDFEIYSSELLERCVSDTYINLKVYNYLNKYIIDDNFKKAIRLELDTAFLCLSLEENGFPFEISKARDLHHRLSQRLEILDNEIRSAFPPEKALKEIITPRGTKSGAVHAVDFRKLKEYGYDPADIHVGKEYEIYEEQIFDPASLKQTIDRLWDAGWKPTEKTKGHSEASKKNGRSIGLRVSLDNDEARLERFSRYGWKLSEENLRTLPDSAPEGAKKLTERLLIASRVSDLEEWINLAVEAPDGSATIFGHYNGIGSWTHRKSTQKPNMQNIPVAQHVDRPSALDTLSDEIADEMRSFWIPGRLNNRDMVLVGTDADGIQMRVFAHYVKDERLTNALVNGNKKDKTTIHYLNWEALGEVCKGYNPSKTFIYAWILGAGKGKVAEILECTTPEAGGAIERFIGFYPGLAELKQGRIPRDAERGYFQGLDGRLVICPEEHRMLAGYLQNGESVIMKTACRKWHQDLRRERIPFVYRNDVHDEWQTATFPEFADVLGKIQTDSIVWAGRELGLNCTLAGQFKVGKNWQETH